VVDQVSDADGSSLWDLLAEGRPAGQPEYRRPGPLVPAGLPLPDVDLDRLATATELDAATRLALFATAVAGVVRVEPRDLVGPHHTAPSIRGMRVTELEVLVGRRWAAYDPVRHSLACRGPLEPRAMRLVADLARVPVGYAPVGEIVGLMEAGMHLATFGWMSGVVYPRAAFHPSEPPCGATSRRALATLDLTREHAGEAHPLTRPIPVVDAARALRSRSSGRGPHGLVPRRTDEAGRARVRARVLGLLDEDARIGAQPMLVSPDVLAAAFTYPADRVDVAAADVAVLWTAERTDDDRDARRAVLAAGAASQRLALALAEDGLFARPVRSFDPVALARGARVTTMATVVGRSAYRELPIPLA
jgi:hypothetical protein